MLRGGNAKADLDFLRIVVSDSGKGIPEEDIGFIFNRFYQSETNQLLQQEGAGIGLALTRELVELHKGRISAKSKVGVGTEIIVELPIDRSAASMVRKNSQAPAENIFQVPEAFDLTSDNIEAKHDDRAVVLVVEDHHEVRNYIKEILGDKYAVISARDGDEGISKAMEQIPDLIISDVMMPNKNGYEVCHTLKNDQKTSHIPIVLLTAKSDSEDRIAGLLTKADDYVTKPFVPRELLVRIENLISSRLLLREKYKLEGVLKPKDVAVNSVDEKFLNRLMEVVEVNMGDEKFG